MCPDLIVQPKGDEDVIKAVIWARENKVAIAVKSGGHQYSGASSTSGKNIQIDLSNTYKDLMVLNFRNPIDEGRALVYVGVSNQLKEFNTYLKHNQLFVTHRDCGYVYVGGYGQTGGYGQLGRSFGLFGDHIRTIRMVCHDGVIRDISKENDFELFYAILGGSPGNFGITSHYTVEVYQAKSYMGTFAGPNGFKGPHGIKGLWIYSHKVLKKLLTAVAQMADNAKVPRSFDLTVNVLSTDFPIAMLFPTLNNASLWEHIQNKIKNALADEFLEWFNGRFPAVIVAYAQWCPTSKEDKWILPKRREFDLPYVKRTYSTNSKSLEKDGWVDSVIDRIDLIYNPDQLLDNNPVDKEYEVYTHCKLVMQTQCFGGANSRFYLNKDNGTSYSWRDTVCEKWQAKNDSIMAGPSSPFSKQDRRLLWGSYGDWNLGKQEVWECYYEDADKYQKLGRARGKADPNGT
ncbi:FAD-linked oxidoreductase [Fusarium oxysporum f. sp. raphani]|uniref:FAD-linked oxidoreductase n=1 Tax=Fusarium oxysporum f. sp. raphani TaxID=96318 RepID=A0A8J5PRB9_FUSOX|nr:FAD-linked oxidoreductase [Fusarium oxysporum f. sp. raphani]